MKIQTIMNALLRGFGSLLARYLSREVHIHGTAPPTPGTQLLGVLRPGDVLLVEGHSRFSTAIKYLTQSTWSHAALYVGHGIDAPGSRPDHCFIEADTLAGVRSIGVAEFQAFHTRICRPSGLSAQECRQVCEYARSRLGNQYDLRNVFDLARYLLPTPPVPQRFRRRMLALGSSDPTRAICSTLIAQAFQSIHYPILPTARLQDISGPDCPDCVREVMHVRHHSLFAPRDFDVSPYFEIVKPCLANGFDFHALAWDTEHD